MTHALRMRWIDLAFLHWRVPPDEIRPLLPPPLELDLFDGSAWIAVVPFRMAGVRPLFAPPIPTATDFHELNVRTYVRHGGRSGVWFFSLDAASWLAVIGARTAVGLPYFHARMRMRRVGDEVQYASTRTHPGARAAEFRARYRPTGSVYLADPGSLDYWLTERYSLFAMHTGQRLRLDIEHKQWPLQHATADVERNTMAIAGGITLPNDAPHVRFARELDVIAQWPARV
jgi:uncharacterized protein YqjF (DUF2071 family)